MWLTGCLDKQGWLGSVAGHAESAAQRYTGEDNIGGFMHAVITAYRQHLVIQLLAESSIPGQVKTSLDNPGCLGQTVLDSGTNLGVSLEALELLKKVKRGKDPVGDLYWKAKETGRCIFAWRGEPVVAISPDTCKASDFFVIRAYTVVPNDGFPPPAEMREFLDVFGPADHLAVLPMAA